MYCNVEYFAMFSLLHDDVATHPGITWSPVDTGLQDRIDFIFYKGEKLHPLAAQVFGLDVQPTNKSPNHGRNVWPSDHFAVLVDFQLN